MLFQIKYYVNCPISRDFRAFLSVLPKHKTVRQKSPAAALFWKSMAAGLTVKNYLFTAWSIRSTVFWMTYSL